MEGLGREMGSGIERDELVEEGPGLGRGCESFLDGISVDAARV